MAQKPVDIPLVNKPLLIIGIVFIVLSFVMLIAAGIMSANSDSDDDEENGDDSSTNPMEGGIACGACIVWQITPIIILAFFIKMYMTHKKNKKNLELYEKELENEKEIQQMKEYRKIQEIDRRKELERKTEEERKYRENRNKGDFDF